MKRFLLTSLVALSLAAFSSCKQHDTSSPDSGGNLPVDKRSESGSANTTEGNTVNPNGNNMTTNATNNNGQSRTADSAIQKQR